LVENDGGVARFTANALEEGPAGGGGGDATEAKQDTIIALIGTPVTDLAADIAAIEAQTDDIGAAGAGLTAIPWNSAWDAEVQSEVADALGVYDPPTKAELDSAVAPLALEATVEGVEAKVDTIDDFLDTEVAAIKAKTDQLTFTVANQVDANALTVDEDEILDDQLTDSIPANGTLPTVRQALYMLTQFMFERSVTTTTMTVNKVDGTTTLMTFTLDDADNPTAISRAS